MKFIKRTGDNLFMSYIKTLFIYVNNANKYFCSVKGAICFFTVILCILILFVILLFVALKNRSIYIGSGLETPSFREEKISAIMHNNRIEYFFQNSGPLIIDSEQAKSKNSNFTILMRNNITTPRLNGKIYKGTTEQLFLQTKDNEFTIPKPMRLKNNSKNYISTLELHGHLDREILSDLYFEAMDDDKFISGNNLYYDVQKDYFKISKNAHVYQINKNNVYDVKSRQLEVFNKKGIAEFFKNVIFSNDKDRLYCNFARLFFDKQHKMTDIFFSRNIVILQPDSKITANYGFFDKNKHTMVLYDNVIITAKNVNSMNEVYFYDTDNKIGFSFNETTRNNLLDKNSIYNILRKMSNNVPKRHRRKILKMIKKNAIYQRRVLSKNGDTYGIDRTKRVKINIVEK